jgi:hypothetical protein
MLWEVKGEKPLHQQVMPCVVICSGDIQEDTVGGLLKPQVMVCQVLQGKHVMESTALRQEARLAGEHWPMITTEIGACQVDSWLKTVGIQLVQD